MATPVQARAANIIAGSDLLPVSLRPSVLRWGGVKVGNETIVHSGIRFGATSRLETTAI
ncbi:MAG: hypothetical protein ACLP8S_32215 [Solirubrobacteraceae bacterium]